MKILSFFRPVDKRRKIQYVDESLQKFLLAGLVLMEVALTAGLTWLMWRHANQIVEDNLYQAHLAGVVPILDQLAQEALFFLGLFFLVNLTALLVVGVSWRHHVNSILHSFVHLVHKTHALDYSADPRIARRHEVLDLAGQHREQARQRLTAFRAHLSALQQADSTQAVTQVVRELRQLLPTTR